MIVKKMTVSEVIVAEAKWYRKYFGMDFLFADTAGNGVAVFQLVRYW